jgi:hypothetical protein
MSDRARNLQPPHHASTHVDNRYPGPLGQN